MNEIKILGFSGKKQSGKNTAANYLVGTWMRELGIVEEFKITDKGLLFVSDIFGSPEPGIFDINSSDPKVQAFAEEHIYPFVKPYSFADTLKQKICIDAFGLSREHCYGTDEQKNELTHLRWEDMPCVITESLPDFDEDDPDIETIAGRIGPYYKKLYGKYIYHKPGLMTGREVMQFLGTEVFRKMYSNIWVDATIRQIKKDSPCMAIITDVRFPNEVDGIIDTSSPLNGKVIRLTRDIYNGEDQHDSEIALDNYDPSRYLKVIDNNDYSILEQNDIVHSVLEDIEWIPTRVPKEILERLES